MMFLCVSDAFMQLNSSSTKPLDDIVSAGNAVPLVAPCGRVMCWSLKTINSVDLAEVKRWARQEEVCLAVFERLPRWTDFSVLITDMDHTLIDTDVLQALAAIAGHESEYRQVLSRLTEGKILFEDSLRERARLLKGLPVSAIEEVVSQVRFTPGIAALMEEARRHGLRTFVLSSGIDDIAQVLSEKLQMTGAIANHLNVCDGILTSVIKGPFGGPLLNAEGKRNQAKRIAEVLSTYGTSSALCCGDSGNDALMLRDAGMGVSFFGTPSAVEAANVNINCGGFEWVLELMQLHERLPADVEG